MKKILTGLVVGMTLLLGVTVPVGAVACPDNSVRAEASTLAECNLVEDDSLWPTVSNILKIAIGILGIVTVAMIIMGGVQYTTSQGDPGKTKKAKDTIMYGIIGLVIAILAYAIVNFVLSSIFGGSGGSGDGGTSSIVTTLG